MPYRLRASDPDMESGLRRVAREQIDGALAALDDHGLGAGETVHEVRKRCKKLRSLVRLVRPAFPDYAAENAAIRDAQRRLSGVRDATALIEAYDALCDAEAARIDRRAFAAIRRRLTAERKRAEAGDLGRRLEHFRAAMLAARGRAAAWRVDAAGFEAVAGGAGETYRRGRKAMRGAAKDPSDAALHDWRKRVKHHRNHARLMRAIWRPALDGREDAADSLGDRLGDHHDLAVLRARIESDQAAFAQGADVDGFLLLIETRQRGLERAAFAEGARLFAEKPKALLKRWGAYWDAWAREAAGAPVARAA